MREIIIVKDNTTYGDGGGTTKGTIDALIEGSLIGYNPDDTVLDGVNPVPNGDYIQLAIGAKDTGRGAILTQQIWRDQLSWEKMTYVAPVAKIMYLGEDNSIGAGTTGTSLNLPATIAAGDVYGIYITDRSKPTWDMTRLKYYSVTATSSHILTGQTAANIIVALIAEINAEPAATKIVTAAVEDSAGADATGISLTGITAGVDFTISHDNEKLKDATISEFNLLDGVYDATMSTHQLAHVRGNGTNAQIAAQEKDFSTEKGFIDGIALETLFYSHPASVEAGMTYTCWALKFVTPNDRVLIRENNMIQELVVAVVWDDASSLTFMDALVAAL